MNEVVSYTEAQRAADAVYNRGGSLTLPTGWQLDTTFATNGELTGDSGVYAYALKPIGADDGRRILAFRGTTDALDLYADATNIGKTQFQDAQPLVNRWFAQQLVDGNRIELVGHSLGGALVQWSINDTNLTDTSTTNGLTSVVEIARTLQRSTDPNSVPDPNFQINPSQLHFTTFNAPGITYVSGLTATDRTTVVSGDHHVLVGATPYVSGDPIHLLGGPPVGGSVIAHHVNFAALGESGFFSHDINKPAYWDITQSPIVSYTAPYMDIGVAQSYATHFSQLGNSDGTVTSDFEAVARLGLFLVASGVALGANTVALSAELRGLPFDRDAFANTIALPVNGINQGLAMILEAAEAAGQNVVDLSARLSTGFVGVLQSIGSFASQVPGFITNTLVPFLTDTANGIGNAVSEFLHDVPNTLFDLGRTLSFAELNPFATAYAQALEDPRLGSALRTALEDAQQIVQQASQTVVMQQGTGPNPFNGAGFNPDAAPPATVNANEGQLTVLTIHLPFEAGVGGQQLTLTLSGPNASGVVLRTNGLELSPNGNTFTLTIPEGQKQLVVGLQQKHDIGASSSLTAVVQLVDANGIATHASDQEATITVTDTGPLRDGTVPTIGFGSNGFPTVVFTPDNPDGSAWNIARFGEINYVLTGGSRSDQITADLGNDQLFGRGGNDLLDFRGDSAAFTIFRKAA